MSLQDPLNLILQIDRLADQTAEQEVPSDESGLALGLTTLIAQSVDADLCLLALPDEVHPRSLVIRAVIDRKNLLEALDKGVAAALLADCLNQESGWLNKELDLNGTRLNVALFSLKRGDAPLGVILVARRGQPFSEDEHALLQIARTQIDNILRYANLAQRLQHETLALRTILKIDRIRDSSSGLDDLLDRSLTELCRVIPAGVGYLMLYNRSGERLELRASTDQGFLAQREALERLYTASDEAIRSGAIVHRTYRTGPIRAILGVPLILNSRIIGVLGVINPTGREDFSFSERQLLHAVASQMDTAIFEQIQTQRLRETFGRSVGTPVMEQLLQIDDRDLLKGERVEIATLFSDIRSFTNFSTRIDATQLQVLLNEHLEAMTRVILAHQGTLDKFIGDGVMALFNVPVRQPDYALRNVVTALEMQAAHQVVLDSWRAKGYEAHPIGIGIATGEAISGNFGSAEHAEYSVIGSCVNLAARLCAIAEGSEILIDEQTLQQVEKDVVTQPIRPQKLKGFSEPVPAWKVIELRSA